MCGIFGIVQNGGFFGTKQLKAAVETLFLLSESRGKEASGFAYGNKENVLVLKSPVPASETLKSDEFKKIFIDKDTRSFCLIGHSRLVTNGYEHFNENNQPFTKNGIIGTHNGIIVNIESLWSKNPNETRLTDLDSEMIPTLIRHGLNSGKTISEALQLLYNEISGMTSIALLLSDFNNLFLATNNGSLYYISSPEFFVFASERYILQMFLKRTQLSGSTQLTHLLPGQSLSVHTKSLTLSTISLTNESDSFRNIEILSQARKIVNVDSQITIKHVAVNRSLDHCNFVPPKEFLLEYQKNKERIAELKRCTRCLLPVTFPFITFDEQGVCNKCKEYEKLHVKGAGALKETVAKFRKGNGEPDCIVAFSGGRDSSYSLHYIKKILGLTPLAYSYDWGMITDLARRNQARMCGKLGVEHILVSADIRHKRKNVQKNVSAWLKNPHLGTIPLFMAGDKQYFYYAEKLKRQNEIDLLIMGENHFEKTGFKIEFSGARQQKKGFMSYHLSKKNKLDMLLFYARQYLKNPAYINQSLLDTMWAFLSYYATPHDYLNLYDYIPWNEKEIDETLLNEYDWETEPGYKSTWRIGDGTAPFYNYIYYTVAGFTENDTLRSNQIREGMVSRDEAMELVENENHPRWSSIKWYLDTINIDFNQTINSVNKMRKRY